MPSKTRTNIYLSSWIVKRFQEEDFLKRRLSKIVDGLLTTYLHGDDVNSLQRNIETYNHQMIELEAKRATTKYKIKDIKMLEMKRKSDIKEKDEFINQIAERYKKNNRKKYSKENNKSWLELDMKKFEKNGWDININDLLKYCSIYSENPDLKYSNWN